MGAHELAQWIKMLAAKHQDLNSVLGTDTHRHTQVNTCNKSCVVLEGTFFLFYLPSSVISGSSHKSDL